MASHHHHHHHQNHNQSCCCCSCNSCYSPPPPPPTTTTPTTDPLLHVIATHILQTSTPFKSQQPLHQHHHHQQQQQKQQQQQQQQKQTQLLQSLLTRIAALETSLADLSSSSRSPPAPPKHHHQNPKRPSLKDLAAKTIQTHFRSHLARQSRALRELRVLSAVRSEARALRSSISGGARPEEVSRAAVGLLARLESVQSGDLMIREGKRSICTELEKVLKLCRVSERGFVRVYECDEEASLADSVEELKEGFEGIGCGVSSRVSESGEDDELDRVSNGERNPFGDLKHRRLLRAQNGSLGLNAPKPVRMEARVGDLRKNEW